MFNRKYKDKKYKVISKDELGLELRIPRYRKTNIKIGTKEEASFIGLAPKGSKNFYTIMDGSVVIDGFLCELSKENKVEMKIKGKAILSKTLWGKIQDEIEYLLAYEEKEE